MPRLFRHVWVKNGANANVSRQERGVGLLPTTCSVSWIFRRLGEEVGDGNPISSSLPLVILPTIQI